ncbi:MAG: MarR family transcriptional regulator [Candidatus Saccharimonadales bacterium]
MSALSKITTYHSGVTQASAYRIVKLHTAHALRDYNLSCMQWFTIGTVLDSGQEGIRLSDLAKKLDTTLAYMTTTVNLLESRDILNKREHKYDARTKLVSVNPRYNKTCNEIENHLRSHLRERLYEKITHEELANYVNVLSKISDLK